MRDVVEGQFSLEILLKHNELRLVEQELSKCQIALEQLRRCHVMPYPTAFPTPQQMLDISSGKGAAVRPRPGDPVPKWAPPFGVVDGPYARHYAKWLIPDPVFDGVLPEWAGLIPLNGQQKLATAEGRTTRNSSVETGLLGRHRPARGVGGSKLYALSNGYPAPKEKAGPCVLRRSDGKTVKLVCIDCHRENFSSTQGFINHCRIAHKRDFKSHEEAAIHCGHPIEVDEASPNTAAPEERLPVPSMPSVPSGLAHPLAQPDQETCNALLSRIAASLKMFSEGRLPGVDTIPLDPKSSSPAKMPATFVGSEKTPYLSRLLQRKNLSVNLSEQVDDAKIRTDFEDVTSLDDDSEDGEQTDSKTIATGVRIPAVSRVPVRRTLVPSMAAGMAPAPLAASSRPASSKGRSPHLPFSIPAGTPTTARVPAAGGSPIFEDEEMDADLSPNTAASNNAPSLVSDDGEYDDSDDASSSEVGDSETDSVSDVAEISIAEDDQGHESPRDMRPDRGSTSAAVKLKKDGSKHVTFVSPVRSTGRARRRTPKI